jgi:hypothetical protein
MIMSNRGAVVVPGHRGADRSSLLAHSVIPQEFAAVFLSYMAISSSICALIVAVPLSYSGVTGSEQLCGNLATDGQLA